ncbi:MAG: DUF2169 domain-containing protein [Polyangiaceae bacterium]
MWEINNETPFEADRTIVVDKTGERHWVVVVKGTFLIEPNGETIEAEEQVPAISLPEYRGVQGESSLVYEQDLIPAKPLTDLYLNASAHAPHGRPATEVQVSLRTPRGTKSLIVKGTRRWRKDAAGMSATPAEPFLTSPIIYERAYGGFDRRDPNPSKHRLEPHNPVGTGFFTSEAHKDGQPLPSVEHPLLSTNGGPAGFGALCSYWEPRIRYQGTYDAAWVKTKKPLLPDDYDPRFLQCAPADQQFEPHLRGGEEIAVTNMTPGGHLRFQLPRRAFAFTTVIGRRRFEHRAKLVTVVLEPDHPRVILVWHSTLSCHHDIDDIDYTDIVEKQYV